VNIVNLSNNHIFDYGLAGYENTKKILKENKIDYFGIENNQIKMVKDNVKIALAGYCCYSTNALGYYNLKTKIGINILNAFDVEKTLIKNQEEGYLSIVSIHAGQEHINYPNYDHLEMARSFASKVNYVYYGHHPHVMQGVEKANDSLIAYSLGNFCFDDVYTKKSKEPLIKQSEENRKSFILSLQIDENKVTSYDLIPIYASKNKMIVGVNEKNIEEINQYSKWLSEDKEKYIERRAELLKNYINNRKLQRDFNWYIKRFNFDSFRIIFRAKYNQNKYKHCIKDYIMKNKF
ncbi:MAG: hypothetical protein ACD_26C00093G0001, partial [uncultured bacterium]